VAEQTWVYLTEGCQDFGVYSWVRAVIEGQPQLHGIGGPVFRAKDLKLADIVSSLISGISLY